MGFPGVYRCLEAFRLASGAAAMAKKVKAARPHLEKAMDSFLDAEHAAGDVEGRIKKGKHKAIEKRNEIKDILRQAQEKTKDDIYHLKNALAIIE